MTPTIKGRTMRKALVATAAMVLLAVGATHPGVAAALPAIEGEVAAGKATPGAAARSLLEIFRKR